MKRLIFVAAALASLAGSVALAAGPPELVFPRDGARLSSFGVTLQWRFNPCDLGEKQVRIQIAPANDDGPGVDVIVLSGGCSGQFAIPSPPTWYGLLPDMGYAWRLRAADGAQWIGADDDPRWSDWSPWTQGWRTPLVGANTISPVNPLDQGSVLDHTPVLQWADRNPAVFYYEVQVSRDRTFGAGPGGATAMVYSNLIHGGITAPKNSYAVPKDFPLERRATYFWRVRPRIQGDGQPIEWSPTWSFVTP